VAAHLSLGIAPACFGQRLTEVVTFPLVQPRTEGQTIEGMVLHIDHFGNILTNIPAALLDGLRPGQGITMTLSGITRTVPFWRTYADGAPQALMCLINSNEEFEVACAQGRAIEQVPARVGDRIVITW
jgi:hypothetical protein